MEENGTIAIPLQERSQMAEIRRSTSERFAEILVHFFHCFYLVAL